MNKKKPLNSSSISSMSDFGAFLSNNKKKKIKIPKKPTFQKTSSDWDGQSDVASNFSESYAQRNNNESKNFSQSHVGFLTEQESSLADRPVQNRSNRKRPKKDSSVQYSYINQLFSDEQESQKEENRRRNKKQFNFNNKSSQNQYHHNRQQNSKNPNPNQNNQNQNYKNQDQVRNTLIKIPKMASKETKQIRPTKIQHFEPEKQHTQSQDFNQNSDCEISNKDQKRYQIGNKQSIKIPGQKSSYLPPQLDKNKVRPNQQQSKFASIVKNQYSNQNKVQTYKQTRQEFNRKEIEKSSKNIQKQKEEQRKNKINKNSLKQLMKVPNITTIEPRQQSQSQASSINSFIDKNKNIRNNYNKRISQEYNERNNNNKSPLNSSDPPSSKDNKQNVKKYQPLNREKQIKQQQYQKYYDQNIKHQNEISKLLQQYLRFQQNSHKYELNQYRMKLNYMQQTIAKQINLQVEFMNKAKRQMRRVTEEIEEKKSRKQNQLKHLKVLKSHYDVAIKTVEQLIKKGQSKSKY